MSFRRECNCRPIDVNPREAARWRATPTYDRCLSRQRLTVASQIDGDLVLTGDIDTSGVRAAHWAAKAFARIPVRYVHGSHEGCLLILSYSSLIEAMHFTALLR